MAPGENESDTPALNPFMVYTPTTSFAKVTSAITNPTSALTRNQTLNSKSWDHGFLVSQ